jgi:hypothetical protein
MMTNNFWEVFSTLCLLVFASCGYLFISYLKIHSDNSVRKLIVSDPDRKVERITELEKRITELERKLENKSS